MIGSAYNYSTLISLLCLVLVVNSCTKDSNPTSFHLEIPAGFPEIQFSDDNPLTAESVELGRRLFYDNALSVDSSLSCATCHKLELAMTDGLAKSIGVEERVG